MQTVKALNALAVKIMEEDEKIKRGLGSAISSEEFSAGFVASIASPIMRGLWWDGAQRFAAIFPDEPLSRIVVENWSRLNSCFAMPSLD